MEFYKCSVSGKKLYYMDVYYDEELGATVGYCPNCGHKEVIEKGVDEIMP
jgi:DNA-directed RNA polymerase subunit RPC12/RpoP